MRRAVATSFVVLVLFFSSVFQSLTLARGQTEDRSYVVKMTVTYSNPSSGTQTWDFTEEDRTISLFMNNTWQTVQLINSSLTIETEGNDTDGNPVAVLRFPVTQLNHGKNINFSTTYRVVSKPRVLPNISEGGSGGLQSINQDLIDKYCGREGPWLTDNSTLQSLARSIAGTETNVLSIIRRLVVWVHNNIHYPSTPHEVPQYPNETYVGLSPLLNEGDCDDQAILLITLSRILGIPAHLQVGAIYMPTIESDTSTRWEDHVIEVAKRIGWHGWAMVYVPPWGWLPVDLTFAPNGIADPLKAITNAAITSQSVIQYMNISKYDYVASSQQAREFLLKNDFYVYLEDEMTEETGPQNPFGAVSREWLIAGLLVAVVILVASYLRISRRLTKRWIEEEIPKP